MGFWNDIWKQRAEDWIYTRVNPPRAPNDVIPQIVKPDSAYISIFLQSMRIVNVRKGLNRFYGTVHSYCSVPHLSENKIQFNVVTTPSQLKGIDAANLDKVITIQKRLLGPIPYRGGDIDIELGLFSIKEEELAGPYLSLLEEASKLASVAFFSTALPYTSLLKDGINLIVGGSPETILEIGLSKNFNPLETGYYVVMRAPKGSYETDKLRIDPEDNCLLDPSGNPIKDYPYMVLKITSSPTREDWFQIPEIAEKYNEIMRDFRIGNSQAIKESSIVFRRFVLACPDLLETDSQRLTDEVEEKVNEFMKSTGISKAVINEFPRLSDIQLYK
jgi:hypothetical protein